MNARLWLATLAIATACGGSSTKGLGGSGADSALGGVAGGTGAAPV